MGSYHNIEVQMEGYINIVIILVIMLSNLTKQKRAYYNDLIFFFIFLKKKLKRNDKWTSCFDERCGANAFCC